MARSKSETRKRSTSESVNILFRLDQRSFGTSTNPSMAPIMKFMALHLECNVLKYNYKTLKPGITNKVLYLSVLSLNKIKVIKDYLNKYPLLGIKHKDFKDREKVLFLNCI